ncbi:MAG: hypothetical protein JJT96_20685, partial [Opitutales bacterium]|nr:hypothetical protein [Opitutales bacterium]
KRCRAPHSTACGADPRTCADPPALWSAARRGALETVDFDFDFDLLCHLRCASSIWIWMVAFEWKEIHKFCA